MVEELMGAEENETPTDFLDKPVSKKKEKKKKKENHEIDLGEYIPESFEKEEVSIKKIEPKPKKEKENIKEDDSFITDVTMPIPKIQEKKDALETYYDAFSKNPKEYDEDIHIQKDPEEEIEKKTKRKSPKASALLSIVFTITLLASIAYMGYAFFFGDAQIKQTEFIINSVLLFIITFCMIISYSADKVRKRKTFAFLEGILMTGFLCFNILSSSGIIRLPQNAVMKDFTGKSIEEALKWADANHIAVEQVYDDSDEIDEYHIVKQSIYPNVLARSIKNVTFTVSSGPDYNKEVVLQNMTGWNIDEVLKRIDENFLNKVTVDFETSDDYEQDIVIEQSKSGQMKRNDEIHFKVSFGKEAPTEEISMQDLTKLTEFKATLWLKRNNIKYTIHKEFSDTVKKGNVMKQNKKKEDKVKPDGDTVELTISKGKKIIVPELSKMSQKEITKWIIENRLKIEFEDRYDMKVKQGNVISANYNKDDEIEEGTTIKITLSKGQLKLPKFSSIDDFRTWATKYNISYKEEYEVNKDVQKGKIIRLSAEAGDVLNPNETIVIYISSGETIVVPNFVGQNKTAIEKTCKNMHLNCTFFYAGQSSKDKDIALSQNKRAGSEVEKDTYVNIGLSSGKTTNNSNVNTSTNKPNTGGNATPKPTSTPTPTCTNVKKLNLQTGDNGTQTKTMIEKLNAGIKFAWNPVNSCPNGDSTSGTICSSSKSDGSMITSCDTVTITYVN